MSGKEWPLKEKSEELDVISTLYAISTARDLLRKYINEKRAQEARERLARELLAGFDDIRRDAGAEAMTFVFEDGAKLTVEKMKGIIRFRFESEGRIEIDITAKDPLDETTIGKLLKYATMRVVSIY
jgi:hypothetical protein